MSDKKTKHTDVDPIEAAFAASRSQRMSPYEITWMLTAAIRIPAIMLMARPRITRQMFDVDEAAIVLLWRGAFDAAERNGGTLPNDPEVAKQLVELHCETELGNDPNAMFYTAAARRKVLDDGGLLDEVLKFKISEEVENTAVGLLARFLRERMLSDPIRRAVAGIGPHDVINDPEGVIAAIELKARELVGMAQNPGSAAVISGYVPTGRKASTTKFQFLDKLMNGGHADSEAYAVLGPSSGGKSALMLQIAMEAAELEAAVAADLGLSEPRQWYYFTWELTLNQLRTRVYSYGARIDINSMNALADADVPLSTSLNPDTIKEYERETYVNSPGNPLTGELDRLADFERKRSGFGNNLHIVDYSGSIAGHGDGGIDEAVGYLRQEANKGRRIGGVIIDYAGLVVNRFINAKNLDPKSEYSMLAGFGNQVRSKISIPFNCKVWVAHQLHGDAAKRKFGKLHSSDARGCRNFADNFDFGIEFGKYSGTTGMVEFTSSKHRHAAGLDHGYIAKFDGRFGVFLDPDEEYVRDPSSGNLVPRSFLNQMPPGGGTPTPPQAGPRHPFNPLDGLD